MTYDARKAQIDGALVNIANKPGGWTAISFQNIASKCDCTHANITRYYRSAVKLRKHLFDLAVKGGHMHIVGQAIAAGYPAASKLAPTVRRAAIESLIEA